MYICDMCGTPIEAGTQYISVFDKTVCLDCAVRSTLDDVMSTFGIKYAEVPGEIFADYKISDETTEQVKNPVFVPTQVGEKNTVLTTLSACGTVWKKAWIYQSASDAEYWVEHYLKNIVSLVSIDGFVSEDDIPDDYELYHVDDNGSEETTDCDGDDPNAIHEKNGWYYPGTDCRDDTEEMTDEEGERAYERAQENRKFWD